MSATAAPPAPRRKRNRKRKRRAASLASSSSSSSSESDDDDAPPKAPPPKPKVTVAVEESSSSESESDTTSESESEATPLKVAVPTIQPRLPALHHRAPRSPSPSPPPAEIPSFLPPKEKNAMDVDGNADAKQQEQVLRERFRKFWMASVADGFKDDLEEIRKEPNLGTSRLALLIDSLASGADVFSSTDKSADINEMEVILS